MTKTKQQADRVDSFTSKESSNIHSAEYTLSSKLLIVRFKEDKDAHEPKSAYSYKNVPETVWEQFKKAPSKGQFMRTSIIGKYTTEKMW